MCRRAVNRYQVTRVSGDALRRLAGMVLGVGATGARNSVLYDEDQVMMLKIVTETVRVSDSAAEYDRGTVGRKPESRVGLARADFAENGLCA